jgi:ATP-dependent exoDNAse (exonuclease V) beta subunit
MNTHIRDALIEFAPGPHKYTCAGDSNYLSVTTWLHSHFPAFDADAIIKKMNLTSPKCKYYGQTPEQIKASWDRGRDEAAAAGTAMHEAIENFLVAGLQACPTTPLLSQVETEGADASGVSSEVYPFSASAPCVRPSPGGGSWGVSPHFMNFIRAHPLLKPYRCEWMIFDEDVKIAGSIDFVAENEDGTLTIYDWKRCKEIKKSNRFGGSALTECISHLPDTNYWHYALQLNTYKTILERKYGKKIKKMYLVGLHPNLPNYQVHAVPELLQEMTDLFALRRTQL